MKTTAAQSGVIDVSVEVLSGYMRAIREGQFRGHASEAESDAEDFLRFDAADMLRVVQGRGNPARTVRVLAAHGRSDASGFWYADRSTRHESVPLASVQEWVDAHDGAYDVLLVCPCNTRGARLTSRQPMLVYGRKGTFTSEDVKEARWNYGRGGKLLFQFPSST
ncbi:MAG: hypothetical protein HYY37_05905 [Candidatus Aenigmarchaeota archaeon]|nr:hypothetical protein [Candidatus Aenigmarchaeota archaeon]